MIENLVTQEQLKEVTDNINETAKTLVTQDQLKVVTDNVSKITNTLGNKTLSTKDKTVTGAINELNTSVSALGTQVTYSLSGTTLSITTK